MATAAAPGRRWFFGPASDLLLGCGLLYGVFFAWQSLAGESMRGVLPFELLPLLTLVFGAPHYGATLLRVYGRGEDRRKYAFFAVHASVALAVAYAAGLYNPWIGSLLVTLYLTWSPWHYSGQNYGIALLFLRRRGVAVPDAAKRFLWLSFVLSYLLTFLVLHSAVGGQAYAPASYQGTLYRLLSLGIPEAVHVPLFLALEVGYLASLVAAAWVLAPVAGLRNLGPTTAVVASQALWFAVPTIAIQFRAFQGLEPLRAEYRDYAFMWVAVGHFLQYLWITTYYAAASEDRAGRARYLVKALLAGTALWVFPTLAFAPGLLGRVPFDMGLALLTASVVNIHHFVLDGAIWKLRDGRIARALLRDPGAPLEGEAASGSWTWRGVLAVGACCWGVSVFLLFDYLGARRAFDEGDAERFRTAFDRRAWLGRDSPRVRVRLARRAVRAGDLDAARADVDRSLALHPTADAYLLSAAIHRRAGDAPGERDAYTRALALRPDDPELLRLRGSHWLRRGRPDRARADLSRALELAPDDERVRESWQRLEAASAKLDVQTSGGPP